MTGEKDLKKLLRSMSPAYIDGEFVFLTFSDAHYGDYADLQPIASFEEQEGLTLVVEKGVADARSLAYEVIFKGITLKIHSSLEAVGLTAAFAEKLTEYEISANVIAGYYHDHIFVQTKDADRAIQALKEIAR